MDHFHDNELVKRSPVFCDLAFTANNRFVDKEDGALL